ncbi:MAG: ABC transporter substrate-binding protein [Desulfobacterales bacterium]|nr:ABC transporter substrate-binding protein [Desulfobacterales bacterium]
MTGKRQTVLTRLLFCFILAMLTLSLSAHASEKWPIVSQPGGFETGFPGQTELQAYERFLNQTLTFKENPIFSSKVASGSLPPVTERLPSEPLVILPYDAIGKYGGTLRGLALSYESGTSEILSWRHTNLVRFSDDTRTIVPNVARAWQWNEDYTQITFFLRKGHRWSDGAPFTADDVVFWFNDIIMNKDIHPTAPTPWQGLNARVQKKDSTTVTFTFNKPYVTLLYYLAGVGSYYDPYAPLHFLKQFHIKYQPKADDLAQKKGFKDWTKLFKRYWNKWTDAVVMNPEGLDVPTLESHILEKAPTQKGRTFVANPYYFKIDSAGNQLPYITRHQERFLKRDQWAEEILSGRVDQKSQNIPLHLYPKLVKHESKQNFRLELPHNGAGPAIIFNKTHKDPVLRDIFLDTRFNKAMSLAINRDKLNQQIFLGLCRPQQALPQNTSFITDEQTEYMAVYNPEKANALLDEMGLKKDADGFRTRPDGNPLVINWIYNIQYVWSRDLPDMISQDWQALGIRVKLTEMTTEQTRKRQAANELDITNEWFSPFEPTLFATPETFMPPYATAHPIMGAPWLQWRDTNGESGIQPPKWVTELWDLGRDFVGTIPGTDWYDAVGREIVRINLENLTVIGTMGKVPLITIVSNRLGNTPTWNINSYFYGYTYPYRPEQWFFK